MVREVIALAVAFVGVAVAFLVFARPRTLADGAAGEDNVTPGAGRSLSIIVPARNEAASLPHLLRSLVEPGAADTVEIIVVDDHSTDGTATFAESFGVQVTRAPDLPAGWSGKNWACATGALAATGSTLVFVDADVSFGPGAVRQLAAVHRRHGGLVSVQPYHRPARWYEELSSLFNAVAVLGSGCFTIRRGERSAAAFGPCVMISRADYEQIGGHAAVRDEVVEDISLAIRADAAGLPVTAWLGAASMSFRMYPDGFVSLVQGWTKNIAMGARLARPLPVIATVVWIAALAATASSLIAGLVGWASGDAAPIAVGLAWILMVVHLRWVLLRLGSFRTATAVLYVVPLAFFVVVFVRSGWFALRGADVSWRGRAIPSRNVPERHA